MWHQVEGILDSALRMDPVDRPAFLVQACEGDEELRHEVESLLMYEGRIDRFMQISALESLRREEVPR